MLFRLRLIIADLALFYVEKSLKSLSQVRSPIVFLIHSLHKEYVISHHERGFCPTAQSFPRPPPLLPSQRKNMEFTEKQSYALAFTILYLLCKARVVTVSEQQKAGDMAVTLERGGTALLQTRAVMVQCTLEASFSITLSHLLLNVQSRGGMLSHNLKDSDMKKGL